MGGVFPNVVKTLIQSKQIVDIHENVNFVHNTLNSLNEVLFKRFPSFSRNIIFSSWNILFSWKL